MNKIHLGFRNPAVIRDNSCQIKIFEKIMKNVFYVEFRDESNGTIQIGLRGRNLLQNGHFRSLDSIRTHFCYFQDGRVGVVKF